MDTKKTAVRVSTAPMRPAPRTVTKIEFGRRIQELLLERNWSQSDLSRRSGVGRDSISNYVNGKAFPAPRALKSLSEALGLRVNEFLPDQVGSSILQDNATIELRQAIGDPGKAWLKINRMMSFDAAARIIDIINSEDIRDKTVK